MKSVGYDFGMYLAGIPQSIMKWLSPLSIDVNPQGIDLLRAEKKYLTGQQVGSS